MNSAAVLLHLAGAVTLLVWAERQVRTGVERAYGAELRNVIRRASGGRLSLVGVGAAVAALLQSSTAVAMLVAGFSTTGFIAGGAGLSLMLGADVGSALVVAMLSLDLGWLTPLLLTVGGWMFLKGEARRIKQAGRVLMGIALILVSLRMMSEATAPLRHSEALPAIVGFLGNEYVTAFLLGALFTWLIHSSVAAILLFAALAAQGVLPMEAGIPLVLGSNVGSGLIAMGLTRDSTREGRRLPLGNLMFRMAGAAVAMIVWRLLPLPPDPFGLTMGQQTVALHLAFNGALAVLGLPFTSGVAWLVKLLLPSVANEGIDHPLARRERALDRTVMDSPRLALASASRELLHMGEVIEVMFAPVMGLFETADPVEVDRLRRLDDLIDNAHSDTKLYLAELNRGPLSEEEAGRSVEITGYAINLEHIADLISKDLLGLVEKRHLKSITFSPEGWAEINRMHDRVLANMRLAMNVLVSGDAESARQLVEEKDLMREIERNSREAHLRRLQSGVQESIDTSDMHLEAIRALKQINSLLALFAYPILIGSGELLESRLLRSGET